MVQPCLCKGTSADVHPECLYKWLEMSGKSECEICTSPYHMEDAVEFKWKLVPNCSVSENNKALIYLCTMIKFMSQSFVLLSGYDPVFVLMTSNFLDICLLYLLQEHIHIMPSWLTLKVASTLSFIVANVVVNTWVYVFDELSITTIVAVFAYIYLVYAQSYQHVRYIYYEEDTV